MLKIISQDVRAISARMFQIAIPIAISGIVMQVQMLIDTAFLARYTATLPDGTILSGSEILSAVGNVFFPYLIGLGFLWSIAIGAVILVSQRLGAKEPDQARRFAMAAIKFNTFLSIGAYLFWFFFAEQVFLLLGVRQPILALSMQYVRFVSLELFFLGTATTIGSVFQGMGITRPEMVTGILRSVLHIVLDYFFIFGGWGIPEMGVAGAGLASSLSGLVSTIALLMIFFQMKGLPIRPDLRALVKAPLSDYLPVLRVGLPTGIEDSLWNTGNLILAYFLNLLSVDAVGIYRLVFQIEITPILFYTGLARAVTTLVGNHTGARDLRGARNVGVIGSIYTALFCLLFTVVFIAFPGAILSVFTPDVDLVATATPLLVITAFTMIPRAINIVSGHGIRGYGDTLWMLATQIFGIVFIISLSYTLMFPLGLGMYGMFIALFLDETLRGVINTVRFYRGETSLFFKGSQAGTKTPRPVPEVV